MRRTIDREGLDHLGSPETQEYVLSEDASLAIGAVFEFCCGNQISMLQVIRTVGTTDLKTPDPSVRDFGRSLVSTPETVVRSSFVAVHCGAQRRQTTRGPWGNRWGATQELGSPTARRAQRLDRPCHRRTGPRLSRRRSQRAERGRTYGLRRKPDRQHEQRQRQLMTPLRSRPAPPRELQTRRRGMLSSAAPHVPTRVAPRSLHAVDHHRVAAPRRSAERVLRSSPPTARSHDGSAAQGWPAWFPSPRSLLNRRRERPQKDEPSAVCVVRVRSRVMGSAPYRSAYRCHLRLDQHVEGAVEVLVDLLAQHGSPGSRDPPRRGLRGRRRNPAGSCASPPASSPQ